MTMNIVDQLVHTTVRIECYDVSGNASCGSGFFFNFCEGNGRHVPAIVTNKHVIKGSIVGIIRMTERNDDEGPKYGSHIEVPISNFEATWVAHPDPKVDLAVLPLAAILEWIGQRGQHVFYKAVNRELVATTEFLADLNAIEDIIMIGYPNGLWDQTNNLPLARRGVTASPPYIDFNGRPEFMIDCACFPGSSGSPVLLYNMGSYFDKQGASIKLGGRVKLIGILFSGPQYTAEGQVEVVPIPTALQVVAKARIPNNLGYCVKANQLLAFEDHFDRLVKAEAAAAEAAKKEVVSPAAA